MMISFESGANKFHYRAASIVIHNHKVLLQQIVGDKLWFIPGGRVEFNESAEETIEREMTEEFAVSILNKELVWVAETFVTFSERRLHELALYYWVKLPADLPLYDHDGEFTGEEEGFVNRWVPIERLDDYQIVPEFVVPELRSLGDRQGIKHIVFNSVR